ncbi:MAG TPA: hypothetical protein VN229_05120 [Terriglobales bacterium]|nr:hypothetical protein [Terriglobales bacterium]
MKRDVAERLLRALGDISFDDASALTFEIADEAERRFFRQGLAEAMKILGTDLVMHIVRQYPDLDPDKR